jgi:glycine hydroxymethyltransferase
MHIIAAKAVSFGEALTPEFQQYSQQVLKNAKAMEGVFHKHNIRLLT